MNSPNISCKVRRLTLIDINDIHIRIKNTDGIDRRSPPNFNIYKYEENNKEKLEKYSNVSLFSHLLALISPLLLHMEGFIEDRMWTYVGL